MLLLLPESLVDPQFKSLTQEIEELQARLLRVTTDSQQSRRANKELEQALHHATIEITREESNVATTSQDLEGALEAAEHCRQVVYGLHADIAAQRAQQQEYDAQSLRLDTDCLKAEDRLEELAALQRENEENSQMYGAAERLKSDELLELQLEKNSKAKEATRMFIQLEAASLEAARWSKTEKELESSALQATQEVSAALSGLRASHAALQEGRWRCETAASIASEREAAVAGAKMELEDCKFEVERYESRLREAYANKELEEAAEAALVAMLRDAERAVARLDAQAIAVESALNEATERQLACQTSLQRLQSEAKATDRGVQRANGGAERAAQDVASSMQRHRELTAALNEAGEQVAAYESRRCALDGLVAGERCRLKALQAARSQLADARSAAQQSLEATRSQCRHLEIKISNAAAEETSLKSKLKGVYTEIEGHEETLYRVELRLLAARRAVYDAEGDASSTALSSEASSLRGRRKQLSATLDGILSEYQALQKSVSKARADYGSLVSILDQRAVDIEALGAKRQVAELNVSQAERGVLASAEAKATLRLRLDKARVALAAAEQRSRRVAEDAAKKAAEVQVSANEADDAVTSLKDKITQLKGAHQEASKDIKALKTELRMWAGRERGSQARAEVLQQPGNKEGAVNEGSPSAAVPTLQKKADSLREAIASTTRDCDMLERALMQGRAATATVILHTRCGGKTEVAGVQSALRQKLEELHHKAVNEERAVEKAAGELSQADEAVRVGEEQLAELSRDVAVLQARHTKAQHAVKHQTAQLQRARTLASP